jgi:hypothetical protein
MSIVLGCIFAGIMIHASGWISDIYKPYYDLPVVPMTGTAIPVSSNTISVLYANIYYANTQYT